jgi:hypothetical protein
MRAGGWCVVRRVASYWVDGEDPQHVMYIPVESEAAAGELCALSAWELQTFAPRLVCDYPKGDVRSVYWIGR